MQLHLSPLATRPCLAYPAEHGARVPRDIDGPGWGERPHEPGDGEYSACFKRRARLELDGDGVVFEG